MDDATAQEIARLRARIEALERGVDLPSALGREPLPQAALLSDSFLTRAFAVLGHYVVASLLIALPFYVLIFVGVYLLGSA